MRLHITNRTGGPEFVDILRYRGLARTIRAAICGVQGNTEQAGTNNTFTQSEGHTVNPDGSFPTPCKTASRAGMARRRKLSWRSGVGRRRA